MRFWRICRERYAADAGSGAGARLFGGRWNSRGVSMVYASTSLALAAVETFVHLEPNFAPSDLVSIEGAIPASVEIGRLDVALLPAGWPASHDESLKSLGDAWIAGGRTAVLLAPCAAIPGEWNVLLNPAHPHFQQIRFHPPRPFFFDARMFR